MSEGGDRRAPAGRMYAAGAAIVAAGLIAPSPAPADGVDRWVQDVTARAGVAQPHHNRQFEYNTRPALRLLRPLSGRASEELR